MQRAMAAEAEAAREARAKVEMLLVMMVIMYMKDRAKVEMMMIMTLDGGDVAGDDGDIDERQGQGEHVAGQDEG